MNKSVNVECNPQKFGVVGNVLTQKTRGESTTADYQNVEIILAVPDEVGWQPIYKMVNLLSGYFNSKCLSVELRKSLRNSTKLLSLVPRRKNGDTVALLIAYDPGQLNAIANSYFFRKRYKKIYAWVIDSFWTDRIPLIAKNTRTFDHIFVMDESDVEEWRRQCKADISALPWGTDVWSNYQERLSLVDKKTVDILRIGRQPEAWADDDCTQKVCEKQGIIFRGRPPFGSTSEESANNVVKAYQESKIILAFSNDVSPTSYTHPTKQYLTARWTDALGQGCVVAGKRPESMSASRLLWEGATVEVSAVDMQTGLQELVSALTHLTEENLRNNIKNSLERLDWRHRFYDLMNVLGYYPPGFIREYEELQKTVGTD